MSTQSARNAIVVLALASIAWRGTISAEPTNRPISLHPDNPHYFLWREKPTVLITSGEHYGALLNLDFDYVAYLDELESSGLNHTRTFSGTYREVPSSFGITDNPLAPQPNRYISPWARSDTPGYHDGGSKFDLSQWDEDYFQRLKDFLTHAARRGVVVELTLFCPLYRDDLWEASPMNAANNVNDVGTCEREEVFAAKHDGLLDVQLAFTRKVVNELRDFDNLYYEVCNEPYFGGVTLEWQHKIVDAIVETEREFPAKHLISMNIANGSQKVTDPHPNVSIFNFHYCIPPDAVAENYGLNKVIGENETGFRGQADVLYRTEGWDFLLAGGALYNNLDYSFTPGHPAGTLRDYKSPGGGSRELRDQLRILKKFIEGFDFVRMRPSPDVVRQVSPELSSRALAEHGQAYAIYLHVPLRKKPTDVRQSVGDAKQATVSLDLPRGRYEASWQNPITGTIDKSETFTHAGGNRQLESSEFTADVALRIVRSTE